MCRKMFSSITIASSTTSPIASTIDSSVSVLIVKPNTYISANAPISDTGIVTIGMTVARKLRRKKKITSTTSTIASPIVWNTLAIERSMNTDVSYATTSFMPGGRLSFILSTSARTAFDSSSGLATACLITPMLSDGLPLNARDDALVDRPDLGVADVADAHRIAADVGDDDVVELLGRAYVGLGDDGELARLRLDASRRDFGVLAADRVLDVLHRQLVAREPRAVEVDAHRHLPLAEDAHVGRARQHGQPRLHVALDVVGRLERRLRSGLHGDVDDRVGVGLDLGDDRLVDRVGQLAARARHLVADVGGGGIRIALQREPDVDVAALRTALRGHHLDALDAGERILERLRDLRLDDFGRRAAIVRWSR